MTDPDANSAAHGYESSGVAARRLLSIAAALVAVIALAAAAGLGLLSLLSGSRAPHLMSPRVERLQVPPAPQLESSPGQTRRGYEREQRAKLEGYRWIDRRAGIVQIPIERAMQLQAERRGGPAL